MCSAENTIICVHKRYDADMICAGVLALFTNGEGLCLQTDTICDRVHTLWVDIYEGSLW